MCVAPLENAGATIGRPVILMDIGLKPKIQIMNEKLMFIV